MTDAFVSSVLDFGEPGRVDEELRPRLPNLIAKLDRHEGCVAGHSASVCRLALATAETIGVPQTELASIALGAILHDIGKVFIDGRLLANHATLRESEWAQIRLHPELGEALLSPAVRDCGALAVVRWHHERWDGTGYPDGLLGDDTPLAARIVATADAYTAMREPRTYREARCLDEALEEMERASWTQLDGSCVRALFKSLTRTDDSS